MLHAVPLFPVVINLFTAQYHFAVCVKLMYDIVFIFQSSILHSEISETNFKMEGNDNVFLIYDSKKRSLVSMPTNALLPYAVLFTLW